MEAEEKYRALWEYRVGIGYLSWGEQVERPYEEVTFKWDLKDEKDKV